VILDDRLQNLLTLLDTSGPELHALLTKLTLRADVAEELMQDLFIKLSQSRGFAEADSPAAYAFRAAVNLALDWRRAQTRHPTPVPLSYDIPVSEALPLSRLVRTEELDRVLDAVTELPEPARQAIIMRYLQQEDFQTVARELGQTVRHVRSLCYKALAQIRQRVGADRPGGYGKEASGVRD
jgi:RNA polymerase sigma-70 factor (ECF subfamily)